MHRLSGAARRRSAAPLVYSRRDAARRAGDARRECAQKGRARRQSVQRELEQRITRKENVARLGEEVEQRLAEDARKRGAIRTLDRHVNGMYEESTYLCAKLFSNH